MSVSRRDFVKVMAVFGSAMIVPEALKAASLPPAQEVIVLPHGFIEVPDKPFLW